MNEILLKILTPVFLLLALNTESPAQDSRNFDRYSDDSLYIVARNFAYDGETTMALEAAGMLLERDSKHYDAMVLIARIYAWDNNYIEAKKYLENVLDDNQHYYDALAALIDIEFWEGNHENAFETAGRALTFHPGDTLFLYQKARALYYMGRNSEAAEILEKLADSDPVNQSVLDLLDRLRMPGFYHYRENDYLLAGYYGEYVREPWSRDFHMGTAGYSRYTSIGPITGKINFANTYFDGAGLTRYPSLQYEIESYPKLSMDSYLLINYAFSRGDGFPPHRGAFEYFRKLPGAFEASLGVRLMYWNDLLIFYTGSVGYYYGNIWLSLRPYLIFGENEISGSLYLNARKYFSSADYYAGIILGYGLSPDETVPEIDDRVFLKAASIGFELSKPLSNRYLVRSSLRYGYEEHQENFFGNRWTLNVGLRYYLTGR